jgi:hypothetical protein
VVLQVGEDLLRERLGKFFQRDLVLAMALSYVELSRRAMSETPPAIVHSCELLERALKLLEVRKFIEEIQRKVLINLKRELKCISFWRSRNRLKRNRKFKACWLRFAYSRLPFQELDY